MATPTTLPVNVAANQTGHVTHTNIIHGALNDLTEGELPEDGTTDIGPLWQGMINSGITPNWKPITYNLNTTVFYNQTSAQSKRNLDFNGATISLGTGLRITDWFRNDAGNECKFGIIVNTNYTASGTIAVTDATRSTGSSSGGLRHLTISNVTFEGNSAYRGAVFCNRTAATFRDVTFRNGRVCHTWFSYTDTNYYEGCHLRWSSGAPAGQLFMEQYDSGDGAVIISPKSDSSTRFGSFKLARGVAVHGAVTTSFTWDNCTSVNYVGGHLEAQSAGVDMVRIRASNVVFTGTTIYRPYSSTVSPISVDDSLDTSTGSRITFQDCNAQMLYTNDTPGAGTSASEAFAPLINFNDVSDQTKVIARGLFGTATSVGTAGKWYSSAAPSMQSATAAVVTAFGTDKAKALIAEGDWKFHRLASGAWTVEPLQSDQFYVAKALATPAITQTVVSNSISGTLTNTLYSYVIAARNSLGQTTAATAEVTNTPTTGTLKMLITLNSGPSIVRVWRKTGAGAATTADRYVDVSLSEARSYVYDVGGFFGGLPWVTTSIPAVPSANTTAATLVLNGVSQTSP